MKGYSDVLIGLQYGDEGKGRIIDSIAHKYDIIARFNGGPNAGHTIEAEGKKIVLHSIPSGVFHRNTTLYIGSGCVVNVEKLLEELHLIKNAGINLEGRLHISDRTTLILPHHIALDKILGKKLGTTSNGIGPAYADRAIRSHENILTNIHLGNIIATPEKTKKDIIQNYRERFEKFFGTEQDIQHTAERITTNAQQLKQYLSPDRLFLTQVAQLGKKILFEGAQSAGLDVNHGTVPYVTSSHTCASAAYTDLPVNYHRKTIGVAKAIMSRVGNGPFISELGRESSETYCMENEGKKHTREVEQHYDLEKLLTSPNHFDIGIALRILGNEYGATTKRPRRIGMLDLVQLKEMCQLNKVDELYLTKIDRLADFSRTTLQGIPFVTAYSLDGEPLHYTPTVLADHLRVQPHTTYHPNILPITSTHYQDLPPTTQQLIKTIEEHTGCHIRGMGIGPQREQLITTY